MTERVSLAQKPPSLEKEKDAVVQFLTHIQEVKTAFYSLSALCTFSPARARHTQRNVDAFFLDCWDQAVLLVCAWEKEDLPERRPKKDERDGESNEGTFVSHPEGRVVEPPHVSDAHLRLDSPSLVLSNQILNDLQMLL